MSEGDVGGTGLAYGQKGDLHPPTVGVKERGSLNPPTMGLLRCGLKPIICKGVSKGVVTFSLALNQNRPTLFKRADRQIWSFTNSFGKVWGACGAKLPQDDVKDSVLAILW